MAYSETLGRGTAKSTRLVGKKSMTRTVARELMFWKGKVYGAPFGGVFACLSREMIDDTGRGAMRWCAHLTSWPIDKPRSFAQLILAYHCYSALAFGAVSDDQVPASF